MGTNSSYSREMGVALSRLWQRVMGIRALRVLILGLDAAGKTTVLYRLKLGEVVTTIPTIGFNIETVTSGQSTITAWDLGYREKLIPLWRHYYPNTTGMIFVLDSADQSRLLEAKSILDMLLWEENLSGVPVLFLANKQDLPSALLPSQVVTELDLQHISDRPWLVVGSSCYTGAGLQEGLDWLAKAMMWGPKH